MGHFLPFYPPNNPKNQKFTKMKKAPGDIIILHRCTKNHDHMLYCSWDMVHDRCNCYFSFSCLKNLNFYKMKKSLEISLFHIGVPNIMIRWCMVPEIWCTTDGRTEGQKKWHIDVCAPLKNKISNNTWAKLCSLIRQKQESSFQ